MALKCADLGHLAAPWPVHQKWVAGLEEELFKQGDTEKQLEMPISPLMDRSKDGITKSQVTPELFSVLQTSGAAVYSCFRQYEAADQRGACSDQSIKGVTV